VGFAPDVYEPEEGKQKVPTLRNVDKRPYPGFAKAFMHNGALKSLDEVVHFYNTRDIAMENWPPPEVPYNLNQELFEGHPIGHFQLSAAAEAAIVAFLKTLTDRQ
jgi:cytochrome c peroxidase